MQTVLKTDGVVLSASEGYNTPVVTSSLYLASLVCCSLRVIVHSKNDAAGDVVSFVCSHECLA